MALNPSVMIGAILKFLIYLIIINDIYPYIPPSTADKKAITPTGMLAAKSTKPGSVLLLQNN